MCLLGYSAVLSVENQQTSHLPSHWYLLGFSNPEDGGDMLFRNVGWLLNGLRGVISHKMLLFIVISSLQTSESHRNDCRAYNSLATSSNVQCSAVEYSAGGIKNYLKFDSENS